MKGQGMDAIERLKRDHRLLRARMDVVEAALPQAAGLLDECMTVNRTVNEHPETRPVFERFFINVSIEGSSCLDETAWRHGMASEELLEQLRRVIDSKKKQPAAEEACSCR